MKMTGLVGGGDMRAFTQRLRATLRRGGQVEAADALFEELALGDATASPAASPSRGLAGCGCGRHKH